MRARSGLALLAVATLAGCGSVSASVIDLRHDVGLICRQANRTFTGPLVPSGQAQEASFLRSGGAHLQAQLARLRMLTPPHGVADVYRAAMAALGQELGVLRTAVRAIHQGEDPALAFSTLKQQITPLENQANSAWQALEIPDCLQ
jgi:hypothetical protein